MFNDCMAFATLSCFTHLFMLLICFSHIWFSSGILYVACIFLLFHTAPLKLKLMTVFLIS
jgi:hypothetical protein